MYERDTGGGASVHTYGNPYPANPPPGTDAQYCIVNQPSDYSTTYFAKRAEDFIQQNADQAAAAHTQPQPWFLYVTPFAPHHPAIPQERDVPLMPDVSMMRTPEHLAYTNGKPPYVTDAARNPDPSVDPLWKAYYAFQNLAASRDEATLDGRRRNQTPNPEVIDDLVGGIFDKLQATGQDQNTLAIFISDNGYVWGEYYLEGKLTPYPYSTRVPMFIRWPGHVKAPAAGQTVLNDGRLVANIDVTPTIMDNLELPQGSTMDGRSLLDPATVWSRDRLFLEYKATSGLYPQQLPSWASMRYTARSGAGRCVSNVGCQYMSYSQSDGTPSPPSWEEYYTDYPHLQSNVFGSDGVPQSGEYDPAHREPNHAPPGRGGCTHVQRSLDREPLPVGRIATLQRVVPTRRTRSAPQHFRSAERPYSCARGGAAVKSPGVLTTWR